ncbi:MAG: protein-L-isoaspartate(D-aspartate) O-methyltransferase [Rhodospirillales bacterium]|nr:protein-L-isoaspartate(D-aspartate) O-methyltransferase [Rhodospirillales bacterium]
MNRSIDDEKLARAHARLLDEIQADARETEFWTGRNKFSAAVMAAMKKVPRHEFVLSGDKEVAYINRPLPIGHGQTISQPYIVALMTDILNLKKTDKVLEIGTGCGYQSAVLAEVAGQVFSIEVVPDLATAARQKLKGLGYDNIEVRHGDGFQGWPEEAPFDAILVTAAPEGVPPALADQLKPGGRMIIPIGTPYSSQILTLVIKQVDGTVKTFNTLPVAFVPMVQGRGEGRQTN